MITRLAAAVGLGIALTATTAAASPTSSAAATLGGPYVALGDSYAAGPGIANQEASSLLCLRSDHDYPTLVAQAVSPTAFTDVSCSGAITNDMTGSQLGAAPQFDALNAGDKLVTLTIGGNDAGFAGIVVTCVALALTDPGGAPCENHYVSGGTDQLAATFAQVGPKVGAVLRGIHQRAPHARVLLVGYPDILPNSQATCAPGNPNDGLIATGDFPWLDSEERGLNGVLADEAAANGATFVDTFTSSVGHDICQAAGTRWIEGVFDIENGGPVHPNGLGMANDARQILAALG
jgi:lysophospholipase L1-like esterase